MGYYIPGPQKGKVEYLIKEHGAVKVATPTHNADFPIDKALICVVDNHIFEAAAFAYSQQEMEEFALDGTARPKTWLTMDLELAKKLSNYNG